MSLSFFLMSLFDVSFLMSLRVEMSRLSAAVACCRLVVVWLLVVVCCCLLCHGGCLLFGCLWLLVVSRRRGGGVDFCGAADDEGCHLSFSMMKVTL